MALLRRIRQPVEVYGFDINFESLAVASKNLTEAFPHATLHLKLGSFLDHVLDDYSGRLFETPKPYDLIIANPPYVRTQIMGASMARKLAGQFK